MGNGIIDPRLCAQQRQPQVAESEATSLAPPEACNTGNSRREFRLAPHTNLSAAYDLLPGIGTGDHAPKLPLEYQNEMVGQWRDALGDVVNLIPGGGFVGEGLIKGSDLPTTLIAGNLSLAGYLALLAKLAKGGSAAVEAAAALRGTTPHGQALAMLDSSLNGKIGGVAVPNQLKTFVRGMVSKETTGLEPDLSQGGLIHRGSGGIRWPEKSEFGATYLHLTENTPDGIRLASKSIEFRLGQPAAHGPYRPAGDVQWVLRLTKVPKDKAWLAHFDDIDAAAIEKALGAMPPSSWNYSRFYYLEFDKAGRFSGLKASEMKLLAAGETEASRTWRMVWPWSEPAGLSSGDAQFLRSIPGTRRLPPEG